MSKYSNLIILLRSLLGALEIVPDSQLYRDTLAVCSYLERSVYRIAVFAPFNHGKSTLLNALLGNKTLPIDLIPTTGAGIVVQYGAELATEIAFQNGKTIRELGTKLLAQYAVLDEDRRMREDVVEVRVSCDRSWLKSVELLDLPGTNDREPQNDLIKDKLLSADLIIQVLDARKLMTLEERQHLTQWIQHRGIDRVVFVINFLNLLTPDEQQEVRRRAYSIAESFRSDLPSGISNIYFVDALPALRARLKGDFATAQATGLTVLESALQTITERHNSDREAYPMGNPQLARVIKVAELLLQQAKLKQEELKRASQHFRSESQHEVKQKAARLIQQGFERSVSDLRGWLYQPKLLTAYQPSLAIALQQTRFDCWLLEFQQEVRQQQTVDRWIERGCEFFDRSNPQLLAFDFPPAPAIQISGFKTERAPDRSTAHNSANVSELNPILQGKVGSVVLGGASYILNKVAPKPSVTSTPSTSTSSNKISSQAYVDAAAKYLTEFSDRANARLTAYEQIASQYITYTPQPSNQQITTTDYPLQPIDALIDNLQTELANL